MTNTIAGTYTTLVTLGSALQNPTTITQTGLLPGGLEATYHDVTVVNAGRIFGANTNRAGVYLTASGTVTNQNGGTISGYDAVTSQYYAGGPITVVNAGTILGGEGNQGYGVFIGDSGSVTNQSGGLISAYHGIAAAFDGGPVTVVNAGAIVGEGAYGGGVIFVDGGSLTNESGGTILGISYGVALAGFDSYASLTNQSGGTISGGYGILEPTRDGPVTLVNAGSITGLVHSGIAFTGAGGSLTNQSGGVILGASYGVSSKYFAVLNQNFGVTVVNAGTITGGSYAVKFDAGSTDRLVVDPGAVFSGKVTGGNAIGATRVSTLELASGASPGTLSGLGTQYVDFAQVTVDAGAQWVLSGSNTIADGATLTDAGTLTNTGTLGGRLTLVANSVLSNTSTGTITASGIATVNGPLNGGAVTVENAGMIGGHQPSFGILLRAGGSVTNQSGGTISGYYGVDGLYVALTVVNAGTIVGAGLVAGGSNPLFISAGAAGVGLLGGGSITNQSDGTISGRFDGVYGGVHSVTVENAGTIIGGSYAVKFAAGSTERLVIDPGAVFSGEVTGGNTLGATAVSTLELASTGSPGTLSGLGTQFVDFAHVTVDAGAQWTLTGGNTLASGNTITNAGTLILSDGTLSGAAAFINNGAIVLDPSSMTIGSLTGSGSVTIQAGSTLDVTRFIASTETIVFAGQGASLVLGTPHASAGSVIGFAAGDTIDLAGIAPGSVSDTGGTVSFTGGSFPLAATIPPTIEPDGHGGTNLVICFAVGTRIGTPAGEVPVQNLAIGDLVLTAHNGPRKVVWIGKGKVLATRGLRSAATPVIVRKGALADNVPNQDLCVTKAHSLYIDNVLIPVEFLVNHRTILWDDRAQEVEIYHVELESHDVLIANGAPAESFRDDGNRWLFQNARSEWDLPPQAPYAPVLTGGTIVDAVWRRLLDRAGPRALPPLTEDPDLHLLVDGTRVDAVEQRGSVYVFRLPSRPGRVAIASREIVPSEFGIARDSRSLGVALRRVTVRQGTRFMLFDAADERLTIGFHAYETDCHLRWTDGHAELPAEAFTRFDRGAEVMLYLGGATQYPDDRASVARPAA